VGIIIEDISYSDKFRPTENDVRELLANIGEPIDIQIDFKVEITAISESQNYDDSGWIVLNPTPSKSGESYTEDLIFSDNPTAFKDFYVGDTVVVTDSFKASNNGTYTITEKIDDSKIRVDTTFTASFVKTNGIVYVLTQFKGLRYFWNFIENQSPPQYINLESQEENQLYYAVLDNSDATQYPMIWNGTDTNRIGSALVRGRGASTYGRKYRINHSTVITPLFIEAQYNDFIAKLKPDYFNAGNCLKNIFRLEVNRELSNPNDSQILVFDERDGNSGWLNENYNGQEENYTLSDLVITRVSDTATLDALELTSQVDATFRVTNTVNSPFSATLTKGMAIFWTLPDSEERYQNNDRTLEQNFVYDYGLNTVGTITNGNNFGTSYQSIEEVEITYVDSDNIDVRIRFDFGSDAISVVNENDFKRYFFGFTIENHSLTRETSDKTTLFVQANEFELQLFDSNLITNNTGFLFHRYTDYVDSITSPEVFPLDDMVASSQFSIDFNGLTADGIDILNVSLIDVEQNRAFTIADNDFRKLVTIQRDSANDTGTTFAYQTSYPFFVRWETWEALSVSNPPSGVYDSSLPNNGLNNFLYRYSTEGYTLNYRLRFTILQNGQQFTQEFDTPLTMYDFDSNAEWTNKYIKPYDVDTGTELTSGGDKFLQGYTDTRLEAAFDKTVGTLPLLADIDIVFWIIGKEKGTIKSVKRASSFYSTSGDTWFKGITSDELVNKTKVVSLYEGKVLVDFTKLSGSEFTVYARIHDNVSGIPLTGKLLEDGTLKLLEDTTTKIIE
jgi:hypothetical protein